MNSPARVLLLEVPQLLRGILEHAIRRHGDCEMQTEHAGPPDFVILGLTDTEDATLLPGLFARWPRAQVMTLMQAGDDAAVYELHLGRRALGPVSPAEILDTLREAVQRRRELPPG